MKRFTKMNPSEKREYWKGVMAGWKSSGLTQKKYCEKEGLSYSIFQSWRTVLKYEKSQGKRKKKVESKEAPLTNNFIPVRIKPSHAKDRDILDESGIKIIPSSRIEIKIAKGFDQETLLKVIQLF